MDFTREPIIQTVITPREGYKIVVRSSKNVGQEEYFVDSIELVSFPEGLFYRSQEKPKPFFVPASDYEIIEVRETKMVLKNVGLDRSIKIAGGKESSLKPKEEARKEEARKEEARKEDEAAASAEAADGKGDKRGGDRKRDRRRDRRRRGRDDAPQDSSDATAAVEGVEKRGEAPLLPMEEEVPGPLPSPSPLLSSLLASPPALVSDTLREWRNSGLFTEAFYSKEELQEVGEEKGISSPVAAVVPPSEGAFEVYETSPTVTENEKGEGS